MRSALLAVLLAGCVRHVPVSAAELPQLDGFGTAEPQRPYQLVDRDGETHPFTFESKLYLVDDLGKRKGGLFKTLKVDTTAVTGELADGTRVHQKLAALDRLELDLKDTGTAVGLALGLGLALIAIVVVGAMAMNGLP